MKTSIKILTYFFVLILVFSITIGYSAFNAELRINAGAVVVPIVDSIKVTAASTGTGNKATISNITYTDNSVNFTFSGKNGKVGKLDVTVTNIGNTLYGIKNITTNATGFTGDIYSGATVLGKPIENNDHTLDGASKVVTFTFTPGGTVNNQNITIQFEFKRLHTVSVNGIQSSHDNYVFHEDDYVLTKVGGLNPNNIEVLVGGAPTINWRYENNEITVFSVVNDLVINYIDTGGGEDPGEDPGGDPEDIPDPPDIDNVNIINVSSTKHGQTNITSGPTITSDGEGVEVSASMNKSGDYLELTLTISNSGNVYQYIKSFTASHPSGVEEQVITNNVIGNINNPLVPNGASQTLTVRFENSVKKLGEVDMSIDLDFSIVRTVTVNGLNATYNNYIEDGDNCIINNVNNIDTSKLKIKVGGITTTNYTYSNNTLTIPNVRGNLIINYEE